MISSITLPRCLRSQATVIVIADREREVRTRLMMSHGNETNTAYCRIGIGVHAIWLTDPRVGSWSLQISDQIYRYHRRL